MVLAALLVFRHRGPAPEGVGLRVPISCRNYWFSTIIGLSCSSASPSLCSGVFITSLYLPLPFLCLSGLCGVLPLFLLMLDVKLCSSSLSGIVSSAPCLLLF